MSQIPEALLYTKDHEWIQLHQDGTATVGITDYAQESLGDITFVEFPMAGESFKYWRHFRCRRISQSRIGSLHAARC